MYGSTGKAYIRSDDVHSLMHEKIKGGSCGNRPFCLHENAERFSLRINRRQMIFMPRAAETTFISSCCTGYCKAAALCGMSRRTDNMHPRLQALSGSR